MRPEPPVPDIPGVTDLHRIGRGGHATVYRGRQIALNRAVAVKVMDAPAGAGGRFQRELRAVGSLSGHPHVVAVYHAGETEGRPYMVMPYLEAGSLQDRIEATGPMTATEVRRLGMEIADALAAAHRLGVLHRDVKPANVLISASGAFQLADFGIARFADATVTNGPLAATVAYAAPEVLAGQPATAQSDIYSLGATMYAALVGGAPFGRHDGESAIALALRIMGDEPADVATLGAPPSLAAVVRAAMAKDPAARPPTAASLGKALADMDLVPEAVLVDDGGEAPAPPERPRRRRRPVVLAGAGALILAGAATAAAVAYPGSGTTPKVAGSPSHPATSTVPSHTPATTRPPAPSASPPPTAPSAPTTTAGATAAVAGQPPLAGSFSAATLTQTVYEYYGLVNSHDLTDSFGWLSPAYQSRIGWAYYQQFWGSISRVDVLSVTPGNRSATLGLEFFERNGNTSTETDAITFTEDPKTGRILIDSYQVA